MYCNTDWVLSCSVGSASLMHAPISLNEKGKKTVFNLLYDTFKASVCNFVLFNYIGHQQIINTMYTRKMIC